MRPLALILMGTLVLVGCTTVQIPNYIGADHPYVRKVYGTFDQVTAAVKTVLAKQGWAIQSEVNPSVYERDARYEGKDSKDLLIFTDVKQHSRILYSTYTHLNVFIHSIGNTTEVEVRYGALTPVMKQLTTTRNDALANRILDAIEQQLNGQ